jgi:hypothetical protein
MSILYLDFIHEQTLVLHEVLSDSITIFSSLLALELSSLFMNELQLHSRAEQVLQSVVNFELSREERSPLLLWGWILYGRIEAG